MADDEKPRVRVVDDEAAIRDYLLLGLDYEGFDVRAAAEALEAREAVRTWDPHVVLLDVMMPGMDGFELAKSLRHDPDRILIFLTARDAVDDRVHGLDLGADDYLVKPFAFKELVARIRRHLRRQRPNLGSVLQSGALAIDLARHRATVDGRPVELSGREFDLLTCFLRHPSQVLPKRTLLDQVWGYDFTGDENIVEVYVRSLREKLGDPEHRVIQTVRGVGYRLGD
jgi:two-component system OmpR family response regulator